MDRIAVLLALMTLAGVAQAQTRCNQPGRLDLVVSAMVLNRACDELSPQTKAERHRIVDALAAEHSDCFAHLQALNQQIDAEARVAVKEMRQSRSKACAEFAKRIDRARDKP